MELFTSTWEQVAKTGEFGYIPVRISRTVPDFLFTRGMPWLPELTDFGGDYLQRLESVGYEQVNALLTALWEYQRLPLVLVCFDHPGCHRRVFADWWRSKTKRLIEELPELPEGEWVPEILVGGCGCL